METNATFEPANTESAIVLTGEAQGYLRKAGSWASFLGILGFIFCALLLLGAVFIGTLFTALANISPIYGQLPTAAAVGASVIIVLVDVLYFFFSLYLYQFGSSTKKGVTFTDSSEVTRGLAKLKSFFKLWGIVTIAVLCIYALEIVFVVIAGLKLASDQHS